MGGPVLEASYGLTRRSGGLVTLSAPPSAQRAEQLGIHAMFFVVTPDAAQLSRLAELADFRQAPAGSEPGLPASRGPQGVRERRPAGTPPGETVLLVR